MPIVLLVDDSPVALRVLAHRLAAAGFEVREACTVAAGRKADAEALACAIVDLELADGNGPDLAVALRATRSSLPVAFFTAGAGPSLLERARACGPVFLKPDIESLVAWATWVTQPRTATALPWNQPPPTK